MKSKHLLPAIWDGMGGAIMGGAMGSVVFWFLGAASVVSGTGPVFALVAGIPALFMAYREGKEAYNNSVQNARAPQTAQSITPNEPSVSKPEMSSPSPQMREDFADRIKAQRAQTALSGNKNAYSRA